MIADEHFRQPRTIPILHLGKARGLPVQPRQSPMARTQAHRLTVVVELTGWNWSSYQSY
jgi:hypothetical protein